VFFRLKQGEFITFADGRDQKVQFKLRAIQKEIPKPMYYYTDEDIEMNFLRIHREAQSLFGNKDFCN
jgi:hypothetical protein